MNDKDNKLRSELRRYIDNTNEIRSLSVPLIKEIKGADNYRECLIQNFSRIGKLEKENIKILDQYFFSRIEKDRLSSDAIADMRALAEALIDAVYLYNMDSPLVYYQTLRLLEEAELSDDEETKIITLDSLLTASYLMISISARLVPVSDICLKYYKVGMAAGERLLEYLEPEKYEKLSEEIKECVVIDSRYIRVVSEIDGIPGGKEQRERNLRRMKASLALADNPFYTESLKSYNWNLHKFRIYEYIATLTDLNNEKGYDKDQLLYINECTKKMVDLYESGIYDFKSIHPTQNIRMLSKRNAYLAGEINLEQYKQGLVELMFEDFRENPDDDVPVVMLLAPLEYILVLDKDNLSSAEESHLSYYYNKLIGYMHQTPKKDLLTFTLSCLSLILKNFIEIPGGSDFESVGLSLIAALHPTTYIHSLTVADLAKMLTHHLIKKHPELFLDLPEYDSIEDVETHEAEIENYAYHASLCHDFGKLMIADTIYTYGRNLLDEEFEFIRVHPSIGAYVLEKQASTSTYADIARGHHKWFNDKGGYPADFSLEKSPYKTIVSIVTCADCIDAATDAVGRSYKEGKTLDTVIGEIKEGSGTQYAPYMAELLDDPEVRSEAEWILSKGRAENYRKTYFILKKNISQM